VHTRLVSDEGGRAGAMPPAPADPYTDPGGSQGRAPLSLTPLVGLYVVSARCLKGGRGVFPYRWPAFQLAHYSDSCCFDFFAANCGWLILRSEARHGQQTQPTVEAIYVGALCRTVALPMPLSLS